MPIIEWAFVCDSAYVDASGKASIIGAFENITADTLPFSHPQMSIAVGLKLALKEEVEVNTVIITAQGKEIARTTPQKVTRADAQGASTLMVIFAYYGTTFSEIGQHHIEILLDGNTARFIPLIIGLFPKEGNLSRATSYPVNLEGGPDKNVGKSADLQALINRLDSQQEEILLVLQ